MGRRPRRGLPRVRALRNGHRAGAAASRAGEWLAAVERSIHRAAAGTGYRRVPRAAAGRLRALLRSLCRLRDVVVARVPPGVLAAVVSASGGVRLDELRALGRLAPAARRGNGLPPTGAGRTPGVAQRPAATGDPEPYAGAT